MEPRSPEAHEAGLYVDGVLDPAAFHTEPFNDPFTLDRLTLGAVVRTSLCCAWAGAIDDLQIYGYPVSAALNSFGASSAFLPFPLPSQPVFACLTLTFQSVAFSPSTLATSDAVLVLLGQ